ncbi:MAG TPA: hypothetical protein VKY57_08845, partial [Chitinispirillaceae bacterium]|nr:hypothetical protein [Chitinispirillaceae bacterium]
MEIDIQRNMEIADRAKLQFSDYAYAPSVQIYTNDSDTLRIGCDAVVSGILIAPHATVTIFSRAQCDGAVYAKEIIIEPDAELFSGLVDPEGDYDGDGLSNYTEIFATHTDPRDPNSFVSMAIPSPSKINNTTQTTVTYDPSVFYGANYSHGKISVTFGANSLINSTVAPPLYISNTPTGTHDTTAENDPPNIPGYETVGNYLRLPENTMDSSGTVRVGFLLPLNEIMGPEFYMCSYKGDDGEWAVAEVEAEVSDTGSIEENVFKVYVDLNRFSSLVLMRKRVSVTAYLDNGMILSNNSNEAKISTSILVFLCPLLSDAFFRIYYTEEGETTEKTVEMDLEPLPVLPDTYHYTNRGKEFSFQENITVTRLQMKLDTILDYTYDVNYSVQKGECLKLG